MDGCSELPMRYHYLPVTMFEVHVILWTSFSLGDWCQRIVDTVVVSMSWSAMFLQSEGMSVCMYISRC